MIIERLGLKDLLMEFQGESYPLIKGFIMFETNILDGPLSNEKAIWECFDQVEKNCRHWIQCAHAH